MKSFALALLAAIALASDRNDNYTGPKSTDVKSSKIKFKPVVATAKVTVTMEAEWTMVKALADSNVTEFAACW